MSAISKFHPLSLLAFLFVVSSCTFISGQGQIIDKQIDVGQFSSIEVHGSFEVELNQAAVQNVVAHGHENIIEKLNAEVSDNVLHLSLESGNYMDYELAIKVDVPTIENIVLSGSGDINIGTFVGLENVKIDLDGSGDIRSKGPMEVAHQATISLEGSGDIDLKLKAQNTIADLDGSGNIDLEGKTADLTVSLDGSGDIKTYKLMALNCKASIGGSGDVKVFASEKLDASIDGSGDIRYKGDPKVKADIDGSGSIEAVK